MTKMSVKKKEANEKTKKTSQYLLTGVIGAALAAALILSVVATVTEEADAVKRIPQKDAKNQRNADDKGGTICTSSSQSTCCTNKSGEGFCTTNSKETPDGPLFPIVTPPPTK